MIKIWKLFSSNQIILINYIPIKKSEIIIILYYQIFAKILSRLFRNLPSKLHNKSFLPSTPELTSRDLTEPTSDAWLEEPDRNPDKVPLGETGADSGPFGAQQPLLRIQRQLPDSLFQVDQDPHETVEQIQ